MAFGSIVQTKLTSNAGSDPASVTFDSSLTAGNLIVICIFAGDGAAAPGTGLTEAVENHDGGQDDTTAIYFRVVQGGDGTTWEVDLPSADQWAIIAREIEGPWEASPLDQTGTSSIATNVLTQQVTAAGATSQADEFVVAAWGHRTVGGESNSVAIASVNNSYINLQNSHEGLDTGARKSVGSATIILTGTATPSVTATFDSPGPSRTGAVIATFKKGSEGGGGGSILLPMLMNH